MGRIIRLPGQKVNRLISCVSAYPAELRRRNWNDKLQQIPYRGRTDLPIHIFIRSLLACWKSPPLFGGCHPDKHHFNFINR